MSGRRLEAPQALGDYYALYQSGYAGGFRIGAGCNDDADRNWHLKVAIDNEANLAPRYYAGYISGIFAGYAANTEEGK